MTVCVHTLKEKQPELSTPNFVYYSMEGPAHALMLKSKCQRSRLKGHKVCCQCRVCMSRRLLRFLVIINHRPLPRCVLMLIYRAVPVKLLCSLYNMCSCVRGSINSLARPKSIICIVLYFLLDVRPTRKFSGFTSR